MSLAGTFLLFQNFSNSGKVDGYFEGLSLNNGNHVVNGWACVVGLKKSIRVKVKAQKAGKTTRVVMDRAANIIGEAGVSSRCRTNGVGHRFRFKIPFSELVDFNGGRLSAYAVSSSGQETLISSHHSGMSINVDLNLAQTQSGWLRGAQSPIYSNVRFFKGIPYAKPPVQNLRFRKSQKNNPWTGIKKAQTFSKACIQYNKQISDDSKKSEDCLTVNVWTSKDGVKKPVLVYIHGGGFKSGASSLSNYDGSFIASKDVVFVSFNYRVGMFGFFSNPIWGGTDINLGLSDQELALRWVQENISAFGGDPDNVTIEGSSAGGASVGYWMTNNINGAGNKPLFHKAIMGSGGGSLLKHLRKPAQAVNQSYGVIKEIFDNRFDLRTRLGSSSLPSCIFQGNLTTFTQLSRDCSYAILRNTSTKVFATTNHFNNYDFHPYLDRKYVVGGTLKSFQCGEQKKIPFIVGSMGWEANIVQEAIADQIGKTNNQFLFGMDKARLMKAYGKYDEFSLSEYVYRDIVFGVPSKMLAEYHTNHGGKAYSYMFNYVAQNDNSHRSFKGANHSVLNAYIFNTMSDQPELRNAYRPTQKDKDVAKVWSAYYLNFVSNNFNGDGSIKASTEVSSPNWESYNSARENRLFINAYGRKNAQGIRTVGDGQTKNYAGLQSGIYEFLERVYFNKHLNEECN